MERPWGRYLTMHADSSGATKILQVNPHAAISLQRHRHRDEYWTPLTLATGLLTFVIHGYNYVASEGIKYYIPAGVDHRIINDSNITCTILEVIKGRYEEDDIVRLMDRYGRL